MPVECEIFRPCKVWVVSGRTLVIMHQRYQRKDINIPGKPKWFFGGLPCWMVHLEFGESGGWSVVYQKFQDDRCTNGLNLMKVDINIFEN